MMKFGFISRALIKIIEARMIALYTIGDDEVGSS